MPVSVAQRSTMFPGTILSLFYCSLLLSENIFSMAWMWHGLHWEAREPLDVWPDWRNEILGHLGDVMQWKLLPHALLPVPATVHHHAVPDPQKAWAKITSAFLKKIFKNIMCISAFAFMYVCVRVPDLMELCCELPCGLLVPMLFPDPMKSNQWS